MICGTDNREVAPRKKAAQAEEDQQERIRTGGHTATAKQQPTTDVLTGKTVSGEVVENEAKSDSESGEEQTCPK
ncbi:MAG: hypothetical protein JO295_15155 [Verrucomicrobia bacterium]|nr:hypothetical protein [Verrucomicrobiota bacterium]